MKWRRFLTDPMDGRTILRMAAALAVAGALFGGAVVTFGLYNVSAKVGHLPGVSWVLNTTFKNAVRLRAGAEPPEDLSSPGMVALGAGHFDTACKVCHAAPGEERSATTLAMVPQPPHITDAVEDWESDEFHWVVHQGVKMSGMPGWPAEREDDVWPVVAFLEAVRDMDGAEYERLTARPGDSYCAMCHGEEGVSDNPQVPRLDILSETYIANSLRAYAAGSRDSGIMSQAMSQVPEAAIPGIARSMASAAPGEAGGAGQAEDDLVRAGRALATEGGTREVPACRACHGPWPERLNPAFPALAGQYAPYLGQQLRLWRDANRGGSAAAELMHHAARNLTEAEIEALAAYYSALAPAKLDDTAE